MSEQRNIAERLLKIADACRRADGTYIPLGEQLQEAADELASLRAQLASASRELADAKSNVAYLSNAAETAFRDRDYYSAQLASARKALEFYAKAFRYVPKRTRTGIDLSTWEPKPELLEDCGQQAASALTDEKGTS